MECLNIPSRNHIFGRSWWEEEDDFSFDYSRDDLTNSKSPKLLNFLVAFPQTPPDSKLQEGRPSHVKRREPCATALSNSSPTLSQARHRPFHRLTLLGAAIVCVWCESIHKTSSYPRNTDNGPATKLLGRPAVALTKPLVLEKGEGGEKRSE